jgi:hypothetical protein
MKTESPPSVTTCAPQSKRTEPPSKSQLIREWIVKLALNAGQALDAEALGVYTALWSDGFEDLPAAVLEAAFRKTLRECKYWPIKVSDVREHVVRAEGNAASEAAERAWQLVLDLRRVHWNPDMPGGFSKGMPQLSERIQQAARAAGVFRDFESVEALHTWAKKRFVESFIAFGKLKQDQFLLRDGEIKRLFADVFNTKVLPAPAQCFENLHKRGLQYAEEPKVSSARNNAAVTLTEFDAEEAKRKIEIEMELAAYGERFAAARAKKQAEASNLSELRPVDVTP